MTLKKVFLDTMRGIKIRMGGAFAEATSLCLKSGLCVGETGQPKDYPGSVLPFGCQSIGTMLFVKGEVHAEPSYALHGPKARERTWSLIRKSSISII